MTVLSRPRRAPRPALIRRVSAIVRLDAVRRRARTPGRSRHDPFFADPAVVEDDTRRLMRPGP